MTRNRVPAGARRGVLAVVGGAAAGQAMALLASPVIARLYSPGTYGTFAVLTAVILPVGAVAALRFEMAIGLPKESVEARHVMSAGLWAVGTASLVILGMVVFLGEWIADVIGLVANQHELLWWAPPIVLATGLQIIFNQTAIRERLYGSIARRTVLQSVATLTFQVLFGLAGLGAHGLAAGMLLGLVCSTSALIFDLRHRITPLGTLATSWKAARQFRQFPLLLAPSGLLNNLGIQIPLLMTAPLYGTEVSGWLGMTQRVLVLPLSLFGLTSGQVILGEFTAALRAGEERLMGMFVRTSRYLLIVGLVCGMVIFVAGPMAFSLLLGEPWARSGDYARALSPSLVAQLVAVPLSQTTVILGRIGLQASWDLSRVAVIVLAIWLCHTISSSDLLMIWVVSAGSTLSYLGLWLISWSAVRRRHAGSGMDPESI